MLSVCVKSQRLHLSHDCSTIIDPTSEEDDVMQNLYINLEMKHTFTHPIVSVVC